MLNKLNNFHSYTMTKIYILVDTYYAFCKRLDNLDYIAKLLEKNKFFCDNIENMNNQKHYYRSSVYRLTNCIYVQGQFFALIIVDAIIIVFYKET